MGSHPWPERENLPKHHIDRGSRAFRVGVFLGKLIVVVGIVLAFLLSGSISFWIVVRIWGFFL